MDTPNNLPAAKLLGRASPARQAYVMLLLLLATVVAVVFIVAVNSQHRIADNERAWFVSRLASLLPATSYDNDLYADRIAVRSPDLLGSTAPLNIYRARLRNRPMAAIVTTFAQDGYGGPIQLLVAIDTHGQVLGVDIIKHSETPGIGDGFEPRRSNWLQRLIGHSLSDPTPTQWTIRKDGGQFDQFTGSSVTPRAILKAVRRALEYYSTHSDLVFAAAPPINEQP